MAENTQSGKKGTLYVVATPIGNLEDLTLRALRILKEADIIACEDTRQTLKLLSKYGIKKRLISYFQPREAGRIPLLLGLLKEGKNLALVSDSGTPGISDPGYRLVAAAVEEDIPVVPVPGATALTAAISASGLPTHRILFLGFPPAKKEKARKLLFLLQEEEATLVFYLPLRKLVLFLELLRETLGNRRVVVARELTKIHEEFIRGEAAELTEMLRNRQLKGEATVLVRGRERKRKERAQKEKT